MTSVGRIVHFVGPNGNCLAMIVTTYEDKGFISGTVFLPQSAPQWKVMVTFDGAANPLPGTWHWPERAE